MEHANFSSPPDCEEKRRFRQLSVASVLANLPFPEAIRSPKSRSPPIRNSLPEPNFSIMYPGSPSRTPDDASYYHQYDTMRPRSGARMERKRSKEHEDMSSDVMRRRAQNRASQKAYRERKEQRIRDLEKLLHEAKENQDYLVRSLLSLQHGCRRGQGYSREGDAMTDTKPDTSADASPDVSVPVTGSEPDSLVAAELEIALPGRNSALPAALAQGGGSLEHLSCSMAAGQTPGLMSLDGHLPSSMYLDLSPTDWTVSAGAGNELYGCMAGQGYANDEGPYSRTPPAQSSLGVFPGARNTTDSSRR